MHARLLFILTLGVCLCGTGGCAWMSYFGTDYDGRDYGMTYFVGGAGPVGNVVGTFDVPKGLRQAGYPGAIETFGWQSAVGGTLRDQMDRGRNEDQGRRLARRIQRYLDEYPGRRVNIIALSAGTGVAIWALEALPSDDRVGTVVFLGSSLSRRYDLSRAMRAIDGRLYDFYSPRDPLLRYGLAIAGSVDGKRWSPRVAGLYGFALPPGADETVRQLYRRRLRNRPYQRKYARYGYRGQHTDSTKPRFIRHVIAPLLLHPLDVPESMEDYAPPRPLPALDTRPAPPERLPSSFLQ